MYNWDMEDTIALLAEYQKKPSPQLRNRIAVLNKGIVRGIAARFTATCSEPYDDLYQIGMLGLLKAIPRFELGQGNTFCTFVYPFVRGEIQHYMRDKVRPIKRPRAVAKLYADGCRLGLSDVATAKALDISLGRWIEVKECCAPLSSLNRCIGFGDEAGELLDFVKSPELPDRERVAEVYEALGQLRAVEREAVVAYFIEGKTRKDYAASIGVSPMTATRRVKSGLVKLAGLLEASQVC